jgi:broad specificity phosphatase PhoE
MRIILLRHEERGVDIEFYSKLTNNGIVNASIQLPKKLKKLKIDIIFSSPFIRTLETIYFYAKRYNKKVNIEYGLYEYLHNPYFLFGKWFYTIDDINSELLSIMNHKYHSIVQKDDLSVLEDQINLERRIKKFFDFLFHSYSDKTILLVSHKGVINKIKDLYFTKTNMNDSFPMGHFEIYDL